LDRVSTSDHPAHAPAPSGACAFVTPEPPTVRRIGGDLLDRIEQAGCQELAVLLAASADPAAPGHATPLDPVASVIAWDLAAGF